MTFTFKVLNSCPFIFLYMPQGKSLMLIVFSVAFFFSPVCGWRAGTSFFLRILPLLIFCFFLRILPLLIFCFCASDAIKQLFLFSCLTFLLPISDFSALFFSVFIYDNLYILILENNAVWLSITMVSNHLLTLDFCHLK